jgi:lysophospholipase L1-like esterase
MPLVRVEPQVGVPTAAAEDVAPSHRVVNCAVGGTITQYWKDHLVAAMVAELPHAVLFYCGSNDLNQDIPETVIVDNVVQCRALVRRQSPTCLFAYFGIIKAPQKEGKWELIDRLNATIRSALPPGDLYVETNAVFCREGSPVSRLFVEDGLHLTDEAYALLSLYARPMLSDWMKEDM